MSAKELSLQEALSAARETRALECGVSVLSDATAVFQQQFGDRAAIIVGDTNTMVAAGNVVVDAFRSTGRKLRQHFVFEDSDLYAEHRFVERLETALREHDAIPVVVGSGTINDVTKLASHRTGRPYMCVATAASMDGYTAYGASITFQGSKQTFDCPAPTAVIADLGVIAAAPRAMNAWGYADLFAKVTAGADWILADALQVEPIDPLAWQIVQGGLGDALSDPAGIRAGTLDAIGKLTEGLMLGGFAMQSTKSSRSASGAEHQFSHLWDMEHHTHAGHAPSHGLKVGIGTLAVTALYEELIKETFDDLSIDRLVAEWPCEKTWVTRAESEFPDGDLRAVAVREIRAKHVEPDALRAQLELLRDKWPTVREALRAQLVPFPKLREMLQSAGAATEPEQIGISRQRLHDSFRRSFFIRRRFTVLDVAVRTGLLDKLLPRLFGPGTRWEIPA